MNLKDIFKRFVIVDLALVVLGILTIFWSSLALSNKNRKIAIIAPTERMEVKDVIKPYKKGVDLLAKDIKPKTIIIVFSGDFNDFLPDNIKQTHTKNAENATIAA